MNEIVGLIENFAPLDTQEPWDCSGFQIDLGTKEVKKVLLCISVTEDIVEQALAKNCDFIVAHHPLFFVPFTFNKGVSIYSAHTNLDKADGGTTDTLIDLLALGGAQKLGEFLRLVELNQEISLKDFISLIKTGLELKTVKVVNNSDKQNIQKIAFCAGSGADFIEDAEKNGAHVIVTGDVKYHQALESNVIIVDVWHFESERPVLNKIKSLLETLKIKVVIADEKSPFINY